MKPKYLTLIKNNIGLKIFSVFLVICIMLAIVFKGPTTIGTDNRHTIFIIIFPIAAGMFILFRLIGGLSVVDGILGKVIALFGSMAISILSLGNIAGIVFDTLNSNEAKINTAVVATMPITDLIAYDSSRNASYLIRFNFKGHKESISVEKDSLDKFQAKGLSNIKLTLRKGIWNHYVVEKWEVIE